MTPLEQAIVDGLLDAQIIAPGVPTPTVPLAAAALGVSEAQIIKSLLFTAGDGGVVLAVLTGDSRVNRQRLAEVAGIGSLKMASPEVVLERTGYPAGGTPPVCHSSAVPVVVDRRVLELNVAYGGGGTHDTMLRIRPADIVRLTGAEVAGIAE